MEEKICTHCGQKRGRGLSSGTLVCDTPSCVLPRVIEFSQNYMETSERFLGLRGHSLDCEAHGKSSCRCGHGDEFGKLYHNLSWAKAELKAVMKDAQRQVNL